MTTDPLTFLAVLILQYDSSGIDQRVDEGIMANSAYTSTGKITGSLKCGMSKGIHKSIVELMISAALTMPQMRAKTHNLLMSKITTFKVLFTTLLYMMIYLTDQMCY